MTNKEKIQSMSAWDLAEFIHSVSNNSTKITNCENLCDECECSDCYCISGIGEWLNEQVK